MKLHQINTYKKCNLQKHGFTGGSKVGCYNNGIMVISNILIIYHVYVRKDFYQLIPPHKGIQGVQFALNSLFVELLQNSKENSSK